NKEIKKTRLIVKIKWVFFVSMHLNLNNGN
ncbi:MAG: hypothetical protein ACI9EW_003673, partial [Cellvibrionaceae bacterium]